MRALLVVVPLPRIEVPEAVVRWSRGQEFAIENVVVERHTQAAQALCETPSAGTNGD